MKTTSSITSLGALLLGAFFLSDNASAASVTLGGPLPDAREATLNSAVTGSGKTGTGNATVTDVESYYDGNWTEVAEHTDKGPSNVSIFTISFSTGNFGEKSGSGTWSINDPNFWSLYTQAAISLHVGNATSDDEPDHFVWKITPGESTGTWSYSGEGLRGGGISNFKLYGTTEPIPDGGGTFALLGASLFTAGALRKATRRKL